MKRREFITLLGGSAAAWPLATRAQQASKLPTIGLLGASTPSDWSRWVAAFVQRLNALGWNEGRTIAIEYRWAEGQSERYTQIATEFVRRKVDIIVTVGSAVAAAKQATSAIPIVFAIANDPLGTGLVASLSRPGGNVTGLSVLAPELAGKRVELLREVIPGFRRLAIMGNASYPAAMLEMNATEAAARTLSFDVTRLEIRRAEDIWPAIGSLNGSAGALYTCADSLVSANVTRINAFALAVQLPTLHYTRDHIEPDGLMSYGPSYADLFRRAADLVDKILRGAKPADIPV
jgi:putative ABC transport system substrate-binding protein